VVADPQATLDSATQKLKPFNLSILTAGTRNGAVHQTLRSSRLDAVLAEARQRYDYVVLDTPPLLPVFDSALLANAVDGVLMVVAANQTPRKLLGEALNMLDPGKVLGIVLQTATASRCSATTTRTTRTTSPSRWQRRHRRRTHGRKTS